MEKNIFEQAAIGAWRYPSSKGDITTEDLFHLGLTQLDSIAKTINRQLKDSEEESFVAKRTAANIVIASKLEVVKYVIAHKQEAVRLREDAANRKAQREKIANIMAERAEGQLQGKSDAELEALLKSLQD